VTPPRVGRVTAFSVNHFFSFFLFSFYDLVHASGGGWVGPDRAFERQNYFLLLLEASFFEWRASSFFDLHLETVKSR